MNSIFRRAFLVEGLCPTLAQRIRDLLLIVRIYPSGQLGEPLVVPPFLSDQTHPPQVLGAHLRCFGGFEYLEKAFHVLYHRPRLRPMTSRWPL